MRARAIVVPILIVVVILYTRYSRPVAVYSQSAVPDKDTAQFRIVTGLKDIDPKAWQGRISVAGAELLSIEGWRFSQQDAVKPDGSFQFRSKPGNFEDQLLPDRYYGATDWNDPKARRLIPEGLIVQVRGSETARVTFESTGGNFAFQTDQVAYGARLPVLEGNGYAERLPMERKLSEAGPADDFPSLALASDGTQWVAWLSYKDKADEVLVSDGAHVYQPSGRGQLYAPAIAADGKGSTIVVWSQNDGGAFHLYASTFSKGAWGTPQKLTSAGGSDLWPRLASNGRGQVALVWQGFRNNQSVILGKLWNGKRWAPEQTVSEGPGDAWTPSASFGAGKLWIAWDSYATGAYQIYAREWGKQVQRVTPGDAFCVRPSVAVDAAGKPVIAWEESDPLWGKDYAFLADQRGTVEYKNRRIRAAYLDSGHWKELPAIVEAVPAELRRFVQQPELALGSDGRLFMAFRVRTSTNVSRIDYWSSIGRWETFVTHLDGGKWTSAIPMPSSVGRNSMRAAIALFKDEVHVVWPTDARIWPGVRYGDLDIYSTTLQASGQPAHLSSGANLVAASAPAPNPNPNEARDLERVRAYRYNLNGKQYRIVRGDFHRHTELSGDGAGDGMLEDNYRYTLDAAALDIGYVSDHQMGQDEEYNWWITQKSNDLYYIPQRFVPMYGYERSVQYPNGHRNIIWAERGMPVLRIGPQEAQGRENSGPILYPYLQKTQGIAMSHTSATQQGTDWRDNDKDLEPLVEIYQGYESNYEEANAPRAHHPEQKTAHQGTRPAGYVWNAWAKGYKLGVQSSSDHVSTHTSYSCILVEDFTRQGILDAIRKRHSYAATDNIVMDFRIDGPSAGAALMGDIVRSTVRPKLTAHILGAAPIQQIDVIKNNTYIYKLNPNRADVSFEYVDNSVQPGENYYYVRAEQADGQLVWSSPIWIEYANGR